MRATGRGEGGGGGGGVGLASRLVAAPSVRTIAGVVQRADGFVRAGLDLSRTTDRIGPGRALAL